GRGELPVLDLVGDLLAGLALLLAVAVDERVGEDPVEPGTQIGARPELVEVGERLGESLLHEVLGVGRVPGHPQGRRVELVRVGPDGLDEVGSLRGGGIRWAVEFNGRQSFPLTTTEDAVTW